jgi:predicted nucleic acid-binding protein
MVYFDTSFIAPLIIPEAASAQIEAFVRQLFPGTLAVSHWTRVEFASLVARRVRMRELAKQQASRAMSTFEQLISDSFKVITPSTGDFETAVALLQDDRAGLCAGDALHLAIALNNNAKTLYTLDKVLPRVAKGHGVRAEGI